MNVTLAHVLSLYIVMYIVYILYSTFIVIIVIFMCLFFTLSISQNLSLKSKKHWALVKIDCAKSTKDPSR